MFQRLEILSGWTLIRKPVASKAGSGPALVLTDQTYNRASGLIVVCPLTSERKPYPFALSVVVDRVEGAVLVDHLKSLDWRPRNAAFHCKSESALLNKVRTYVGVLLSIR